MKFCLVSKRPLILARSSELSGYLVLLGWWFDCHVRLARCHTSEAKDVAEGGDRKKCLLSIVK